MASHEAPRSLLIHDGELADVCALMTGLGIDFVEHRGRPSSALETHRWELLVSTPKRLLEFEVGGAVKSPTRIAVLDRDSKTLRSMLQRAGVDLVVRRPVHPVALRLLLVHSLYRGPEKRRSMRVSIGASVRFRSGLRRRSGVLADLSASGCRLLSSQFVKRGQKLSIQIPGAVSGGKAFSLAGMVVRAGGSDFPGVSTLAISFGKLSMRDAARLRQVVTGHVGGPAMLSEDEVGSTPPLSETAVAPRAPVREVSQAHEPAKPPAAACEAPKTAVEVEAPEPERRSTPRHAYSRKVIALGVEAARVLIGRDVSFGGMRVDPHPDVALGDELRIALHLRAREEPLVVDARVARDDGDEGLVLQFFELSERAQDYLRRMVDFLPILAMREEGDEGRGIVVSEIMEHHTSAGAAR